MFIDIKQIFFVLSAYYIICVVTPWISKNSYPLNTYDDI